MYMNIFIHTYLIILLVYICIRTVYIYIYIYIYIYTTVTYLQLQKSDSYFGNLMIIDLKPIPKMQVNESVYVKQILKFL